MSNTFPITEKSKASSIPIHVLATKSYAGWLKAQPVITVQWLEVNEFKGTAGTYCLLPDKNGGLAGVVCGTDEKTDLWSIAHLTTSLPPKTYHLEGKFTPAQATQLTLGWALASYKFTRYKKNTKSPAMLIAPKSCDIPYVSSMTGAIFWARDMINTPANDMNPEALAHEAVAWAKKHKAQVSVIKGEALLKANYPMIYAVGKASDVPPHLVDIRFPCPLENAGMRKKAKLSRTAAQRTSKYVSSGSAGNEAFSHSSSFHGAPKVTLVGKGVCFDSGGLDIKSTANMKLMKKDMGGAACVLALARTIVELKLPVQLRVLLPIVENSIAGNAMRPLDIVPTRKGIHVEIGNTDAEGRLILCDALYEADSEKPDLLVDCATLTGAARVALGTEIPAFFTSDNALANELMACSDSESDPLWRLPLWKNYRKQLDNSFADISNDPENAYGGAITAALYLEEFVSKTPSWLHIDMMAWNVNPKPGRPQGGEAMAIRALYALVKERYGNTN